MATATQLTLVVACVCVLAFSFALPAEDSCGAGDGSCSREERADSFVQIRNHIAMKKAIGKVDEPPTIAPGFSVSYCSSFACVAGFVPKPDQATTECAAGGCDSATCCNADMGPPIDAWRGTDSTTWAPSMSSPEYCSSFACVAGFLPKPYMEAMILVCPDVGCNADLCCHPNAAMHDHGSAAPLPNDASRTGDPASIAPSSSVYYCSSFACVAGFVPKPDQATTECAAGSCDSATCCDADMTEMNWAWSKWIDDDVWAKRLIEVHDEKECQKIRFGSGSSSRRGGARRLGCRRAGCRKKCWNWSRWYKTDADWQRDLEWSVSSDVECADRNAIDIQHENGQTRIGCELK